ERDAGHALIGMVFRFLPTLAIVLQQFDEDLTVDPVRWMAYGNSVALRVSISFGLRFLENISSFWLLDFRCVEIMLMFATTFFSGFLVPLSFWPQVAQDVVVWLPWAGMIQAPMDVVLGKVSGADLLGVLLFQVVWAVCLMLIGRALLALAVRR